MSLESSVVMSVPSRGVGAVLVHVVVREVVGPHGGALVTGVQVDQHVHLPGGHVHQGTVLVRTAALAHLDPVDRDIELVRLERGPLDRHGPDGGDDPPPVRVVAEAVSYTHLMLPTNREV